MTITVVSTAATALMRNKAGQPSIDAGTAARLLIMVWTGR